MTASTDEPTSDAEVTNFLASGVPTRATDRDPDEIRDVLEAFLRRTLPGATEVAVTDVSLPGSSGVANETIMCSAAVTGPDGTRQQGYVVRLSPGDFLYMDVDLSVHAGMYQALKEVPGVPVPTVVGYEPDASLLGGPFFVMERIEGRVPEDTPPFHTAGWVTELDEGEREAMWRDAVAVMARLHQVDPGKLPFLQRPARGASGLEQDLGYWFQYDRWACGDRSSPVIDAGREWLVANLPEHRPTELSWGDCRVGNMMFRDGKVVGLFDWDMVSLAGAETDLAWWTINDYLTTCGAGVERLAGIGSPAETIRLWQEHTGRDVPDLWFHLVSTPTGCR